MDLVIISEYIRFRWYVINRSDNLQRRLICNRGMWGVYYTACSVSCHSCLCSGVDSIYMLLVFCQCRAAVVGVPVHFSAYGVIYWYIVRTSDIISRYLFKSMRIGNFIKLLVIWRWHHNVLLFSVRCTRAQLYKENVLVPHYGLLIIYRQWSKSSSSIAHFICVF